jgi:hypothetical protein
MFNHKQGQKQLAYIQHQKFVWVLQLLLLMIENLNWGGF